MLQYWLCLQCGVSTGATHTLEHRKLWDEVVMDDQKNNELPGAAWLDEHMPTETLDATSADESVAAPATPPEIHEQCQAMMRRGDLPQTTAQQRRRNRPCIPGEYGTPPMLTQAWRWGYTSPNLPNPYGFKWKHRDGKWLIQAHIGG